MESRRPLKMSSVNDHACHRSLRLDGTVLPVWESELPMPFSLVRERNPLTFGARRNLSWSGWNDPDGLHTCPRRLEYLSWKGTREGGPPIGISSSQRSFNMYRFMGTPIGEFLFLFYRKLWYLDP